MAGAALAFRRAVDGLGLTPHAALHLACLLAAHPALVVSSTYRTPEHNRRVGGVHNSFHIRRRAADLTGPLSELDNAARTARAQRVSHGCTGPEEVLVEDRGRPNQHLHLAW